MSKRKFLYFMYYISGVFGFARLAVTAFFLFRNPMGLPLRFLQLIPSIAIIVALVSYYKLFNDGVPVITVIAPTLVHAILIYIFIKQVILLPFIPLVIIDILFLTLRGVKANLFPFDIDGEYEDDLLDIEELTENVE